MDPVDVVVANIGTFILATGALGVSSFGIVEGLKRLSPLGEAGFAAITRVLGPLFPLLRQAYGVDVEELLRAQYRGQAGDLARVIRQGARVGLSPANAEGVAKALGIVDPTELKAAAAAAASREALQDDLRAVRARFDLAVDARVDAALTLAQDNYARAAKIAASVVAIVIALVVDWQLFKANSLLLAFFVGLAAVPLAPIAKDVASAVKAAADALRSRV